MKILVGIMSYALHSKHMNYGATLHSYAFQQILKKYGIDSIIIDYVALDMEGYNLKYPLLNKRYDGFLRNTAQILNWVVGYRSNILKYNKFRCFFKNFLKTTVGEYRYRDLVRLTNIEKLPINVWVCESDVIWKIYEERNIGFDKGFFLNFPATKNQIKIAYSPSMRAKPLSKSQSNEFLSLIKDFNAISLRERQGAEYASSLIGQHVEWVLDPTLLLSASDYKKIAVLPKERKYVLLYSCMRNDQGMIRQAEAFARRKNLKLIEISNYSLNRYLNHHKVISDAGIEEWLGYFMNADYVICNAFHGLCFSVLFEKDVYLFQRDNSDYRMQNITEALGLSERLIGFENRAIPLKETPIDYDLVNKKLQVLRQKSLSFIENNIVAVAG